MKNFLKYSRPFLLSIGVALLFFVVFFIITTVTKEKEPQPAPDITGVAYDETTLFSLSENFGLQGTALVFVDPMIEEDLLHVTSLMTANDGRSDVVAVSVSDHPFNVQKAEIEEMSLDEVRFVFDADGEMAKTYGISGTPVTYFIDKNGMIQDAHLGGISANTLNKAFNKIA